MISLLIIVSLATLPNSIYTSVPFTINPGCVNSPECNSTGNSAIYYAKNFVGDNTIHMIYSSFDDLTISIFETAKGYAPVFNYTALFAKNYTGALQFNDTKPINSLSLVIRRLIQFDDANDDGLLNEDENTTISYSLTDTKTNDFTTQSNITDQPTFQIPLENLNGSLTIDIVYPGATMRDSKFPKLKTTPKSFFVNIGLQANNFTEPKARFAFEVYLMLPGNSGSRILSSRYIDDQYTPGIFNVWQMRSLSTIYPSSMLWKPVVYQSEDRSIEQNTLMQVYSLTNNVTLNSTIDNGIYTSLLPRPYVSAFNVSLGQANDGFFVKSNYAFIQFTVGLDLLETDSTTQFVTIALIASLALPAIVGIIAVIFIIKRRLSQKHSSYDAIQD